MTMLLEFKLYSLFGWCCPRNGDISLPFYVAQTPLCFEQPQILVSLGLTYIVVWPFWFIQTWDRYTDTHVQENFDTKTLLEYMYLKPFVVPKIRYIELRYVELYL